MKFSAVAAVAALAIGAQAGYSNVTYTTEVVTAYTTYCPEATTLTHGGKTYTVTSATTLTITDCPCTVTKPVYTSTAVPYSNSTSTKGSSPTGTGATTSSKPTYTGAASKFAVSGGALAGLLGIAAFAL